MSEYDRLKIQFDEAEAKQRSKTEVALRNCLALATRMRMMPNADSQWEHIVRFCKESGLEASMLRSEPSVMP